MMNKMYLEYFTEQTNFPFFIQYGYHEEDLPQHIHKNFNELTIVLSGTAIHVVNNEKHLIQKGDVFVIGDNIAHGFENPHDFKICNIMYHFHESLWNEHDIRESAGFHALFVIEPFLNKDSKFKSRLRLSTHEFEFVRTQIASMINEYQKKGEGYKTILFSYFMCLVVFLSRAYQINLNNTDPTLNLALPVAYMGNHFTESISMEMLAKMANMSVRHFSRMFQKIYNISPSRYLIQYRIQYSYSLLKNPNLTISEIAYASGFNDSNYYSRQFKKNTGFSPLQYRQLQNQTETIKIN